MTSTMHSEHISEINRSLYNGLWSGSTLQRPERFSTWPLVSGLLPASPHRLEIGPGLRPRLPISGTHFIDISESAIDQLRAHGGIARPGTIGTLPFDDGQFDLVCAFDVIEHVRDGHRAFSEVSRVLRDGGIVIFSVPLHAHLWTEFDEWSGHALRYDPLDLLEILALNQLVPEQSAAFGMQPANPLILKTGLWFLKNRRREALFFYNRVFMPLGMFFQKKLNFAHGLMDTAGVDEIVLVCRRGFRPEGSGKHVNGKRV